jgi:hypothetical protein
MITPRGEVLVRRGRKRIVVYILYMPLSVYPVDKQLHLKQHKRRSPMAIPLQSVSNPEVVKNTSS